MVPSILDVLLETHILWLVSKKHIDGPISIIFLVFEDVENRILSTPGWL